MHFDYEVVFLFLFLSCKKIIQQKQALVSKKVKSITLIFSFFIALIDFFAWWIDALSSVTIHSDIGLIFTKVIAYTKIHLKKSQNLFAFPVSSVIKQINYPFDKIAEIIDHLPVATVHIIELVIPLGSQLYCLFKSLLKHSFINIYK